MPRVTQPRTTTPHSPAATWGANGARPAKLPKKIADEMMVNGELTIGSTPNCHGTAWEMMRAFQGTASTHVQLGYGDFNTATTDYEKFKSLGVTARAGSSTSRSCSRATW